MAGSDWGKDMMDSSDSTASRAPGASPRRGAIARKAPGLAIFGLALALAACSEQPEFLAFLLPEPDEDAYAQPAVYRDPDAPEAAPGYGPNFGDTVYDGNDEIVHGKCLPDHPVSYCITIDGMFKQPVVPLAYDDRARFLAGNRVFNANWVPAPQSNNEFRDGLGPFFNARSCAGCHVNNGRGRPPLREGGRPDTMVMLLSISAAAGGAEPRPHPRFGGGFNYRAVPGIRPEGRVSVAYEELRGHFADGESYSLRMPRYEFSDLAFGPLGEDTLVSPRVAPPVIGLGLIEAVEAETILALADPDDADGDGISGRANFVPDPVDGEVKLGRFGWKAGAVSLRHQTAAALNGDMGITSPVFLAGNCTEAQNACAVFASGGNPEIRDQDFGDLVYYVQFLGPTARRHTEDAQVSRGEALFEEAGCAACHVPRMVSGAHPDQPMLSYMIFHPYADFLLHDMGKGLADDRPDFEASGREWRTPPLWGIGLTEQIGKHAFFLHDGRARGLMEAILWHGGEATSARRKVRAMDKAERTALIAFLNSL